VKFFILSLFSLFFSATTLAKDAEIIPNIPQLLGVWYGEYQSNTDTLPNEMWMEISYQKSVNGFVIRGSNRWNIVKEGEERQRAESKGRHAQYFDRVSGRIHQDLKTFSLTEDQRQSSLQGTLIDTNTMQVKFTPQDPSTTSFEVILKRINTHYSPDEHFLLGIDVSHHSGNVDWQQSNRNRHSDGA